VVFVALDGDRCVAMAGGFVAHQQRGDAMLWGMWVESSARRHGIGRRLVEAVVGWARGIGVRRLMLAVAQDAASRPAAALYRELGFEETGESEPLQSDPSSVALLMARAL
jgi:[ribosomal protein S18]-alanine N-acetyltransferase